MLTQKDFDEIEKIIDEKLDQKIKFLPTKDDFYTKMDEVMGELQEMREDLTVVSGYKDRLENHEERITRLEENASP